MQAWATVRVAVRLRCGDNGWLAATSASVHFCLRTNKKGEEGRRRLRGVRERRRLVVSGGAQAATASCSGLLLLDYSGIKHDEKTKSLIDFLNKVVNEPIESLIIVDMIQRLGVKSQFREQIKAILMWQYTHFSSLNHGKDDVYEIALRFRLLRQEGYRVPADVFAYFNDKGKGFVMKLEGNIKGMMELYEASQVSTEGEDILDEAECFSSKWWKELGLGEEMKFARDQPLKCFQYMKKCFKVLNDIANDFGKIIFEKHGWNPTRFLKQMDNSGIKHEEKVKSIIGFLNNVFRLLRQEGYYVPTDVFEYFKDKGKGFIMKLEGNVKGMMELYEASQMSIEGEDILDKAECFSSRWWKESGLGEVMKFARDQPLKWYLWSIAILTDASLSELRVELVKPVSLVYIIDDIFDVHGKVDELILFTGVIKRCDDACAKQLPEYMKKCVKVLSDITNDFGNIIFEKHGWNPTGFLKQMVLI
ncbi:(3S,6E)-nerolidol synthase 1 [Eucalyptus grandis]|uniref:(3S,6E)-nerolidol synthase 1 n=1 Tax=Eucalyptus grandis TaxID=71139 RepID=UPI00192E9A6D|nr:(3S,6E)-nerolidol synthase 1 [Eucalyptus grandis]